MAPTRRAQILMEPEEFRRLQALARERRTSVANLIRSAVRDTYLAPQTAKPGLGAPSRRTESGPCGSFLIRVSFSTRPARLTLEGMLASKCFDAWPRAHSRRPRTARSFRKSSTFSSVAAVFPDLLPVTGEDMRRACDLVERYPTLSVRDAVHAATMLGNGLQQVISVDEDFDQIRKIRRVAPENV